MNQLRLFPAPGSVRKSLPEDVQNAAREILAQMLKAVVQEKTQVQSNPKEGERNG